MDNEFAALSDLGLEKGIKHSEIISSIHDAILLRYYKSYPKGPKNVEVVVDEKNGTVRLISENTDVTPPKFKNEAASIARQVIIGKIKNLKTEVLIEPPKPPHGSVFNWLAKIIFWGYNVFFLFYLGIFLLGLISGDFRKTVFEGISNLGFFKGSILFILIATPVFSIFLAVKNSVLKETKTLGRLFFLFEMPTIFLSLLFLTLFTELTPSMWFFMLMVYLIPISLLIKLIQFDLNEPRKFFVYIFFHQSALTTAAYITLLFSFFVPPIIFSIFKSFFGGIFYQIGYRGFDSYLFSDFISLFFGLLFYGIISFIAGMILILPYVATYILAKFYWQLRIKLVEMLGEKKANTTTAIFAFIYLVLVISLSYQPDVTAHLSKLKKIGTLFTFEQREEIARELLPHEKTIKQAVKDMYDIRRKYLFAKGDNFLKEAYHDQFNFDDKTAQFIQDTFVTFAYPFVYQGPTDNNGEISNNYYYLFGKSVWDDISQAIPIEEVKVLSRKISADTDRQGVLATISVEEEYNTANFTSQEVIYEFSLPNDAVVTDLKLGPNLEFPGVIAPKGAAKKTYERELNRRRDPALLEQTGPRQYRLRVFPIPGKNETSILKGRNQRIQFKYVVAATDQGYPLPVFTKKQNVSDKNIKTLFTFNGKNISAKENDLYLKDPKTGGPSIDLCSLTDSINLQTSNAPFSTSIVPHSSQPTLKNNYTCPKNLPPSITALSDGFRIAVLYDVSYENRDNPFPDLLRKTLKGSDFLDKNRVDLYFYNDYLSKSKSVTKEFLGSNIEVNYFGKSDLINALQSFSGQYDFAIVATGKNTSLPSTDQSLNIRVPLYLIHTDGQIPPYGNRFINYLYQNKGMVVDSFEEAINHYVFSQTLQKEKDKIYVSINPYWSLTVESENAPDIFSTSLDNNNQSKGPIAFWKFDEVGQIVNDSSGNGNNGTLGTDSILNTDDPSRTSQGKYGSALYFNGSSYARMATSYFPIGNSPRSISAWIKTTTNTESYFVSWGSNSPNNRFSLGTKYGKLIAECWGGGKYGATSINDNVWHFVAVTYDGTTTRLYLDGKEESITRENTWPAILDTRSTDGNLGKSANVYQYFFQGALDQVKIYNYARTPDEIVIDMEWKDDTDDTTVSLIQQIPKPDDRKKDTIILKQNDTLSSFAAHAYLIDKISQISGDLDKQLNILDRAHKFAVNNHIVTPYSSLIALVNETQRQNLERDSQSYDRYEDTAFPIPIPPPMSGEGMFISPQIFSPGISNLKFPTGYEKSGVGGPPSNLRVSSFGNLAGGYIGLFIILNVIVFGIGIFILILVKIKRIFWRKR